MSPIFQTLGPGDLHEGLPEEYYFYDAISNNYKNSMVWAKEDALAAYREGRSQRRRPSARVVYRCDVSRCLLLEVVDTSNGAVLFLPGYKVSRKEALRRGCALRTYLPRAGWLDQLRPPGGAVGLECDHHVLDVQFRDVFIDVEASSPVSRLLPGGPTCPSGIGVAIYSDRFDGLDPEALEQIAEARARFVDNAGV